MDLQLAGTVAVVGGASRGLGLACARALAREGARVALVARDAAALREAAATLQREGGTAQAFPCDLLDRAAVAAIPAAVRAGLGSPDVLVLNAAVTAPFARAERVDAETFERTVLGNVRLAHALVTGFLPDVAARRRGRIVAVGSLAAELGGAGQLAYATGKAALGGFIRTLAVELGPQGVTANLVLPGAVDTERLAAALSAESRAAILRRTALGRLATPEEVAALVVFLCGAQAAYVTGATLPVTGGYELNERL